MPRTTLLAILPLFGLLSLVPSLPRAGDVAKKDGEYVSIFDGKT